MKRYSFLLTLLFLLLIFLLFPETVQAGATYGLQLWYQILLPSLLPFLLLTGLLCRMTTLVRPSQILAPFTEGILHLPRHYTGALILGLLSGMPIGASLLSANVPKHSRIPLYPLLLSTCLSPGFLTGYLCTHCFGRPDMCLRYSLLFYLLHFLFTSLCFRTFWSTDCPPLSSSHKDSSVLPSAPLAQMLEDTISSSLTSITKIAVYVMAFSTAAFFLQDMWLLLFPQATPLVPGILCGILEVTTGCSLLYNLNLPLAVRIPLLTGIVSFGGLSGIFQTRAMLEERPFPLLRYIKMRATIALLMAGTTFALMHLHIFN